jgi:hypothetical protein
MSLVITAMEPLSPPLCLLCGERFEAEGYSERFKPEMLPGVPMGGFAPAILVEGSPAGFVCPACFGDGAEDLAHAMTCRAERLRRLARDLEWDGAT